MHADMEFMIFTFKLKIDPVKLRYIMKFICAFNKKKYHGAAIYEYFLPLPVRPTIVHISPKRPG